VVVNPVGAVSGAVDVAAPINHRESVIMLERAQPVLLK
jgi:hypothetical protein